jgi:PEP-CTERM motif-containing protein
MKRTLVASILGLAATAVSSYGQGTIVLNNYATPSYQPVQWGTGVTGQTAGTSVDTASVEIELLYAVGTFSSTSAFLAASPTDGGTTFIDPTVNEAGSYGGGGPGGYYDDSSPVTISGWFGTANNGAVSGSNPYDPGSDPVTFLTEGWLTTGPQGGSSYNTALAHGISALWTETAANVGVSTAGICPLGDPALGFANGPTKLIISAVPEPTTMAVMGLGAAGLLALRRRKA